MALTAIGMMSSVSAQTFGELNASNQVSSDPDEDDFSGENTEFNSSLEGPNAQDSGDNFRNETADVDVRVTSQVAIDITPENLNYPFVDLGEQELVSNESHRSVTIRNTGSEAIDRVWVNASTPVNDPFGDGSGTFEAGNFFQINISKSTVNRFPTPTPDAASSYHYVNRIEYMFQDEDEVPSFIVAPNGTDRLEIGGTSNDDDGTAPSEIETGALRVGGQEYYFTVLEASSGGCDGDGDAKIRIGNTPFTSSQEGTFDFTDDGPDDQPRDFTEYDIEQGESGNGVGVVVPDEDNLVDLGTRDYELLTRCDDNVPDNEESVLRTRYNPTALAFDDLSANGDAQFIFSASDEGDQIEPSQFITLDTAVEVPRGVDQGQMDTGTFRVYVTSDNA
jgi:hypothetical protein